MKVHVFTNSDNVFDCAADTKEIHANPASITCTDQTNGCLAAECCTVTASTGGSSSKTCANTNSPNDDNDDNDGNDGNDGNKAAEDDDEDGNSITDDRMNTGGREDNNNHNKIANHF